jgi:hypothetical protein
MQLVSQTAAENFGELLTKRNQDSLFPEHILQTASQTRAILKKHQTLRVAKGSFNALLHLCPTQDIFSRHFQNHCFNS